MLHAYCQAGSLPPLDAGRLRLRAPPGFLPVSRARASRSMVARHLLDSLAVIPYLYGERLLDIGSGAGIRAWCWLSRIPIVEWVLRSEPQEDCLRQVLIELELERVEIVHARAEDYRPERAFSTVISRAVGSLDMLVRLAMPVSRDDGRILAMKGSYPAAEIEALGSRVPEARVHVQRPEFGATPKRRDRRSPRLKQAPSALRCDTMG